MSIVPNFLLEQSQAILEQCAFGVCIANKDGVMTRVNRSFEKITGLKSTHFIGRHVKQAVELGIIDNSSILKLIESNRKCTSKVKTMAGKELLSNAFRVYDDSKKLNLFATIMRGINNDDTPVNAGVVPGTTSDGCLHHTKIVGNSPEIREIFDMAKRLSCFDCPVLIEGETGVGKGLFAEFIHNNSPRRHNPFITLNCGAIPAHLLESELFGYAYGAFTGANPKGKKGLFEQACGGTIFLDEIGELPPALQVKLLRVLEKQTIHKLGTLAEQKINIRILAASNQNLLEMMAEKKFRADLFYRLNVVSINIPPLRERRIDIPDLINYYLDLHNRRYGTSKNIGAATKEVFLHYSWPGNVRELSNLLERIVITARNDRIGPDDLPENVKAVRSVSSDSIIDMPVLKKFSSRTLREELQSHEKKILAAALKRFDTQDAVARELGVSMSTLTRKLNKYKIHNKTHNSGLY